LITYSIQLFGSADLSYVVLSIDSALILFGNAPMVQAVLI